MAHLGPSLRRRSPRAARPWRRGVLALVLSLLVNGLALWRVDVSGLKPRPGAAPPRDVSLAPLSPQQWAANRSVTDRPGRPSLPPGARPAPPPPEQPKAPPQAPGQVVETAPSKDERAPKDSRFVSERNNTVEKETRSRFSGTGGPGAPGPRSPPKPPPPQPPAVAAQPPRGRPPGPAGERGQATEKRAAEPGKLALAPGPRADVPALTPDTGAMRGGARGESQGGEGQEAPDSVRGLNLRPSASDYDRLVSGGGGGGSPDHIEGVEEGDTTFLNTREWKYAGYFNRIKQAVAEHWNPVPSITARDPDGAKFGYKDWHTLLSVKLDASGGLKAVSVARSSGLDFLDRTAMDAFRAAQPFNNPPPGLADERGDIAFTFGFYLQMGSPGLRLFRR